MNPEAALLSTIVVLACVSCIILQADSEPGGSATVHYCLNLCVLYHFTGR